MYRRANSANDKDKKELTPAEKAEQKVQRIAAEKIRKKKVNAPSRIVKIQASFFLLRFRQDEDKNPCSSK